MARQKESNFGDQVDKFLKKLPYTWFIKVPAFQKGLPDRIVCVNGQFVALELKKDAKALKKSANTQKLQHHRLGNIAHAGAYAVKVSPENWEEVQNHLWGFLYVVKTNSISRSAKAATSKSERSAGPRARTNRAQGQQSGSKKASTTGG